MPLVDRNTIPTTDDLVEIIGIGRPRFVPLMNPTIIGSGEDCHLRLFDASLDPIHCVLAKTNEEWIVRDLLSRNGIRLNGRAVDEAVICHGDRLLIGRYELRVKLGDAAAAPEKGAPDECLPLPTADAIRLQSETLVHHCRAAAREKRVIERQREWEETRQQAELLFEERDAELADAASAVSEQARRLNERTVLLETAKARFAERDRRSRLAVAAIQAENKDLARRSRTQFQRVQQMLADARLKMRCAEQREQQAAEAVTESVATRDAVLSEIEWRRGELRAMEERIANSRRQLDELGDRHASVQLSVHQYQLALQELQANAVSNDATDEATHVAVDIERRLRELASREAEFRTREQSLMARDAELRESTNVLHQLCNQSELIAEMLEDCARVLAEESVQTAADNATPAHALPSSITADALSREHRQIQAWKARLATEELLWVEEKNRLERFYQEQQRELDSRRAAVDRDMALRRSQLDQRDIEATNRERECDVERARLRAVEARLQTAELSAERERQLLRRRAIALDALQERIAQGGNQRGNGINLRLRQLERELAADRAAADALCKQHERRRHDSLKELEEERARLRVEAESAREARETAERRAAEWKKFRDAIAWDTAKHEADEAAWMTQRARYEQTIRELRGHIDRIACLLIEDASEPVVHRRAA